MRPISKLLAILLLLFPPLAGAETVKYRIVEVTTGTGFFVTPNHIVTNAHVIPHCKSIMVRGAIKPTQVDVVTIDKTRDLALLYSKIQSSRSAYLRANAGLQAGDAVTVIGYPLKHGITGRYLLNRATIINVNTMVNGFGNIEFTESVERGNSGGPLLDRAGNVIGVVVGKMLYYHTRDHKREPHPYKTSGIAIGLPVLKAFLDEHQIFPSAQSTYDIFDDHNPQERAEKYLVNVVCLED